MDKYLLFCLAVYSALKPYVEKHLKTIRFLKYGLYISVMLNAVLFTLLIAEAMK